MPPPPGTTLDNQPGSGQILRLSPSKPLQNLSPQPRNYSSLLLGSLLHCTKCAPHSTRQTANAGSDQVPHPPPPVAPSHWGGGVVGGNRVLPRPRGSPHHLLVLISLNPYPFVYAFPIITSSHSELSLSSAMSVSNFGKAWMSWPTCVSVTVQHQAKSQT